MLERERLQVQEDLPRRTPSLRCSTTRSIPTTSTSAPAITCRGCSTANTATSSWRHDVRRRPAFKCGLKLEVWDSPNSAGVVIGALRCLKLARIAVSRARSMAPSSYFKKSPPIQLHDDIAFNRVEAFIGRGQRNPRWHRDPAQACHAAGPGPRRHADRLVRAVRGRPGGFAVAFSR